MLLRHCGILHLIKTYFNELSATLSLRYNLTASNARTLSMEVSGMSECVIMAFMANEKATSTMP